eukprot:TRINITY_DN60475_c0_g1_i1.p1 TRINITY_DN60475_c0_g1~~TRINITY_DN60475_c0_g1_i1.p1  ORF type:complete len:478 (+),score=61.79 TRINITY_DN60475_c0_g1_i1:40-1473(+)
MQRRGPSSPSSPGYSDINYMREVTSPKRKKKDTFWLKVALGLVIVVMVCGGVSFYLIELSNVVTEPPIPECIPELTCYGHGKCNSRGACDCFSDEERGFWVGTHCGMCKPGYWGEHCALTHEQAKEYFDCKHGELVVPGTTKKPVCICEEGWEGELCDLRVTDFPLDESNPSFMADLESARHPQQPDEPKDEAPKEAEEEQVAADQQQAQQQDEEAREENTEQDGEFDRTAELKHVGVDPNAEEEDVVVVERPRKDEPDWTGVSLWDAADSWVIEPDQHWTKLLSLGEYPSDRLDFSKNPQAIERWSEVDFLDHSAENSIGNLHPTINSVVHHQSATQNPMIWSPMELGASIRDHAEWRLPEVLGQWVKYFALVVRPLDLNTPSAKAHLHVQGTDGQTCVEVWVDGNLAGQHSNTAGGTKIPITVVDTWSQIILKVAYPHEGGVGAPGFSISSNEGFLALYQIPPKGQLDLHDPTLK